MTSSTQPVSPADESDDALEADAQATIAKALRLFESGEKELAERLFERLRQRVKQAGPTAMLIGGIDGAQEPGALRDVVSAIADIARAKPAQDAPAESE
jgi:hypothetical protein